MTPKSYITLCTVAILYVIMAAVAVVSPHGNSYALPSGQAQSSDAASIADDTESDTSNEPKFLFTNEAGLEVILTLSDISNNFATVDVTADVDGQQVNFKGVHLNSLITYSGMTADTDMIVLKGDRNNISACRTVDLQKDNNAYLIFADANGNPLDNETYGTFCIYVKEGSKSGFFEHMNTLDFG